MIEKMLEERRVQLLIACIVISIVLITVRGISTGLDLQGGSLIQIKTERALTQQEMQDVVDIMDERLRGGLKVRDVKLKPWGDEYVLVYIAGVDAIEAGKLIGKPGRLVVTVGNVTAFTGDELVRVDPFGYEARGGSWGVPFTISSAAAERFRNAAIETNFALVYMYMDDVEVNSAPLSPTLQQELAAGQVVKSLILETGGGEHGREEARRIEVILRSGALPIKVNIVGSYDISAALGEGFANAAILAGVLAFAGVAAVVYIRYRKPEFVLPILLTGASEILIILGVASLIRWDIDLPAIAGIIAAVGTGMDNQIVILDEILMEKEKSMRAKMKGAFFIVIGSWMTLMAAMVPLFIVGFGMLQGFAVTTIIGATAGVFITRPAYAKIIQQMLAQGSRHDEHQTK
ncbi:MAG: preprotein translocase subunit SecD [Methanobacteriota archaeon]